MVTIEFRSASVTHPILGVSWMSKRGIQIVLGHRFGYLQKGSKRLDLMRGDDLYFLRPKMVNDEVPDCARVMRERGDFDEDDAPD